MVAEQPISECFFYQSYFILMFLYMTYLYVIVYRAARHGLTLNGKLKRIQEQELEVKQNDGTDQDKVEFRDRIRNRKRKRNKDSNSSVRKRTKE